MVPVEQLSYNLEPRYCYVNPAGCGLPAPMNTETRGCSDFFVVCSEDIIRRRSEILLSPGLFSRHIRRRTCKPFFRCSRGHGLVLQLLELCNDRLLECIYSALIQPMLYHESLFPIVCRRYSEFFAFSKHRGKANDSFTTTQAEALNIKYRCDLGRDIALSHC